MVFMVFVFFESLVLFSCFSKHPNFFYFSSLISLMIWQAFIIAVRRSPVSLDNNYKSLKNEVEIPFSYDDDDDDDHFYLFKDRSFSSAGNVFTKKKNVEDYTIHSFH